MKQYVILTDASDNSTYGIVVKDGMTFSVHGAHRKAEEWAGWANSQDQKSLEQLLPPGITQSTASTLHNDSHLFIKGLLDVAISGASFVPGKRSYIESHRTNAWSATPSARDFQLSAFSIDGRQQAVAFKALAFKSDSNSYSFAALLRSGAVGFNPQTGLVRSRVEGASSRHLQAKVDASIPRSIQRHVGMDDIAHKSLIKNRDIVGGQIEVKKLGGRLGGRLGGGLRAAPTGFVFIDVTGRIDADKDGIVFESTPMERPIIPRFTVPENLGKKISSLLQGSSEENEKLRRAGRLGDADVSGVRSQIEQLLGADASQLSKLQSTRTSATRQPLTPERARGVIQRARQIGASRVGRGEKTQINTEGSRAVEKISWDDKAKELIVTFNGGRTYTYKDVDDKWVKELESNPDFLGRILNDIKKQGFQYERGGKHAPDKTLSSPAQRRRESVGLRSSRRLSDKERGIQARAKITQLQEGDVLPENWDDDTKKLGNPAGFSIEEIRKDSYPGFYTITLKNSRDGTIQKRQFEEDDTFPNVGRPSTLERGAPGRGAPGEGRGMLAAVRTLAMLPGEPPRDAQRDRPVFGTRSRRSYDDESGSRGIREGVAESEHFVGSMWIDQLKGDNVDADVIPLADIYGDDRPGYAVVGVYRTDDGFGGIEYFYGGDDEEFDSVEDAMDFLQNIEDQGNEGILYGDPEFRSLDRVRSAGKPGRRPLSTRSSRGIVGPPDSWYEPDEDELEPLEELIGEEWNRMDSDRYYESARDWTRENVDKYKKMTDDEWDSIMDDVNASDDPIAAMRELFKEYNDSDAFSDDIRSVAESDFNSYYEEERGRGWPSTRSRTVRKPDAGGYPESRTVRDRATGRVLRGARDTRKRGPIVDKKKRPRTETLSGGTRFGGTRRGRYGADGDIREGLSTRSTVSSDNWDNWANSIAPTITNNPEIRDLLSTRNMGVGNYIRVGNDIVTPRDLKDILGVPSTRSASPYSGPVVSGVSLPTWDDLNKMRRIPGPTGLNEGYWFEDDSTGRIFFAKRGRSDGHAEAEVAGSAVYRVAGAGVPHKAIIKNEAGETWVVSEKVDNLQNTSNPTGRISAQAKQDMGLDMLLQIRDAWSGGSNKMVDPIGVIYTVDTGGAGPYRAQGEPKFPEFSPDAEWRDVATMIHMPNAPIGAQHISKLYGRVSNNDLVVAMRRVEHLNLQKIDQEMIDAGVPPAMRKLFVDTIAARQKMAKVMADEFEGYEPGTRVNVVGPKGQERVLPGGEKVASKAPQGLMSSIFRFRATDDGFKKDLFGPSTRSVVMTPVSRRDATKPRYSDTLDGEVVMRGKDSAGGFQAEIVLTPDGDYVIVGRERNARGQWETVGFGAGKQDDVLGGPDNIAGWFSSIDEAEARIRDYVDGPDDMSYDDVVEYFRETDSVKSQLGLLATRSIADRNSGIKSARSASLAQRDGELRLARPADGFHYADFERMSDKQLLEEYFGALATRWESLSSSGGPSNNTEFQHIVSALRDRNMFGSVKELLNKYDMEYQSAVRRGVPFRIPDSEFGNDGSYSMPGKRPSLASLRSSRGEPLEMRLSRSEAESLDADIEDIEDAATGMADNWLDVGRMEMVFGRLRDGLRDIYEVDSRFDADYSEDGVDMSYISAIDITPEDRKNLLSAISDVRGMIASGAIKNRDVGEKLDRLEGRINELRRADSESVEISMTLLQLGDLSKDLHDIDDAIGAIDDELMSADAELGMPALYDALENAIGGVDSIVITREEFDAAKGTITGLQAMLKNGTLPKRYAASLGRLSNLVDQVDNSDGHFVTAQLAERGHMFDMPRPGQSDFIRKFGEIVNRAKAKGLLRGRNRSSYLNMEKEDRIPTIGRFRMPEPAVIDGYKESDDYEDNFQRWARLTKITSAYAKEQGLGEGIAPSRSAYEGSPQFYNDVRSWDAIQVARMNSWQGFDGDDDGRGNLSLRSTRANLASTRSKRVKREGSTEPNAWPWLRRNRDMPEGPVVEGFLYSEESRDYFDTWLNMVNNFEGFAEEQGIDLSLGEPDFADYASSPQFLDDVQDWDYKAVRGIRKSSDYKPIDSSTGLPREVPVSSFDEDDIPLMSNRSARRSYESSDAFERGYNRFAMDANDIGFANEQEISLRRMPNRNDYRYSKAFNEDAAMHANGIEPGVGSGRGGRTSTRSGQFVNFTRPGSGNTTPRYSDTSRGKVVSRGRSNDGNARFEVIRDRDGSYSVSGQEKDERGKWVDVFSLDSDDEAQSGGLDNVFDSIEDAQEAINYYLTGPNSYDDFMGSISDQKPLLTRSTRSVSRSSEPGIGDDEIAGDMTLGEYGVLEDALDLVRRDGTFSDEENRALSSLSDALGNAIAANDMIVLSRDDFATAQSAIDRWMSDPENLPGGDVSDLQDVLGEMDNADADGNIWTSLILEEQGTRLSMEASSPRKLGRALRRPSTRSVSRSSEPGLGDDEIAGDMTIAEYGVLDDAVRLVNRTSDNLSDDEYRGIQALYSALANAAAANDMIVMNRDDFARAKRAVDKWMSDPENLPGGDVVDLQQVLGEMEIADADGNIFTSLTLEEQGTRLTIQPPSARTSGSAFRRPSNRSVSERKRIASIETGSSLRSSVSTAIDGLQVPGARRIDEQDGRLWESLSPEQRGLVEARAIEIEENLIRGFSGPGDIRMDVNENGDIVSIEILEPTRRADLNPIDDGGRVNEHIGLYGDVPDFNFHGSSSQKEVAGKNKRQQAKFNALAKYDLLSTERDPITGKWRVVLSQQGLERLEETHGKMRELLLKKRDEIDADSKLSDGMKATKLKDINEKIKALDDQVSALIVLASARINAKDGRNEDGGNRFAFAPEQLPSSMRKELLGTPKTFGGAAAAKNKLFKKWAATQTGKNNKKLRANSKEYKDLKAKFDAGELPEVFAWYHKQDKDSSKSLAQLGLPEPREFGWKRSAGNIDGIVGPNGNATPNFNDIVGDNPIVGDDVNLDFDHSSRLWGQDVLGIPDEDAAKVRGESFWRKLNLSKSVIPSPSAWIARHNERLQKRQERKNRLKRLKAGQASYGGRAEDADKTAKELRLLKKIKAKRLQALQAKKRAADEIYGTHASKKQSTPTMTIDENGNPILNAATLAEVGKIELISRPPKQGDLSKEDKKDAKEREKLEKEIKAGNLRADRVLGAIWGINGYNERPTIVTEEEFIELAQDSGNTVIRRGHGGKTYAERHLDDPERHTTGDGGTLQGPGEYWSVRKEGGEILSGNDGWRGYVNTDDQRGQKGTEPGPGGTVAILPANARIIRADELDKIKKDMTSVSGGIATALKDPSLPKDWRNATTGAAAEQLVELIQDNLYRSVPEGDPRWETTGGKVISELVSAVRNASNPEERAKALDALRYFVLGTNGLLKNYLAPLLGYDAIRANSGVMLVMNRGALIEYGGVGGLSMTDGLEQAIRNNSRMAPELVKKINRGERVD